MAYNYGGFGGNAHTYGGGQDYNRYRGGDSYGNNTFSGSRDYDRTGGYNMSSSYGRDYGRDYGRNQGYGGDYGYGGGYGGNNRSYQVDTYTTSSNRHQPSYGGGYGMSSSGMYGPSTNYQREDRSYNDSNRGIFGGHSSSSRRYGRDTDRSAFTKYRNNRDTSTSSSDDNNGEGFFDRVGDKIKGVFGYGPEAGNNNRSGYYGNNDNNNNYGYGKSSSSRRNNKYDTNSYNYNTGYGSNYGYGGNDVVSLRGRREVAPSIQEESGSKQLIWQLNAQGFDLDNIQVHDAGNNKIEITGHAETSGQNYRRTKQFTRIITLPEGSDAKQVKSRISGRGLLTITVPYTGKGLSTYGTRELQIGQGTSGTTVGSSRNTGTTGGYSSTNNNTTGGQQYQQHTTTSTTRSSTNA